MKKILLTMLLAIMLLPLPAVAQTWVEPYIHPDGTMTPGQWSTKADDWQKSFSSPGMMNPFTGQFNRYGRQNPLTSSALPRNDPGSAVPGYSDPKSYSIPGSNAPNSYLIPGSNAPNPHAAMGSNPTKQGTGAGNPNTKNP
jgi:hypothetical protein